ncbi:bifunctional diguanylate cyclase/phosphodiesterase [Thioalkalivibrio sp. ALJ16]|uniref:putative bifunctional diguanylate cyclase/phosphodiesterase n=1 Tax=Thioalkalivibrio sp. ALJ16 TaxID=1158762 RepID=UPI00037CF12C|nr:EAL domain-containing protein [Thioalkalivibrio sp. ALJ16]
MSPSYRTPDEVNALQERIHFLEEALEANAYAMDVLASTTAIFGDTDRNRSPELIIQNTIEAIRRLLPAQDMAVYILDNDCSFNLAHQEHPDTLEPDLAGIVEQLIEDGQFAWALHQNHPVCLPSPVAEESIMLHVISTRTRIRGMFVARFRQAQLQRYEMILSTLTMVLFNTAYALESADLFQMMDRRQKALQRITERQSRELLHHMSHDSLTNLPNRMLFSDRLSQAIERHAGSPDHVALILLDLDNFKRTNDSLGHRAGDELIRKVAQDLSDLLDQARERSGRRLRTTLSRLGGDEFGILVEDALGLEGIVRLVTDVVRKTATERQIFEQPVVSSVSCGIAVYPYDGENADTLLGNADAAMYEAKQRGRNGFRFYTQDLNSRTFRHFELENELGQAIANDQLVLHYQPKVALDSGRILGAEALIRWQHPTLGLLPPSHFIDLAEDMTLIEEIGEWVLRQVCRDLQSLRVAPEQLPRIAINVSARQLRQPDLAGDFHRIIGDAGIPPRCIELELTESTIVDDPQGALRVFQRLRELGMSLAVDDFGTGHASLMQLKQLPADTLKIDRSFVMDLDQGDGHSQIVRAIILMARTLGLDVIAEGVETARQAEILQELDCHTAQGYLYSRPVPFGEFRTWLRDAVALPTATA